MTKDNTSEQFVFWIENRFIINIMVKMYNIGDFPRNVIEMNFSK